MSQGSKVELFISCSNLKNKDLLSKSDPLVRLCVPDNLHSKSYKWVEFGRTEMIK